MSGDPGHRDRLPDVLRPPLTRNVALLLQSRIPARLAWLGPSGTPRVVAIWFVWNGSQLVMTTFANAGKVAELDAGDEVAVTIDTESFPYRSLRIGGPVTLEPVQGLAPAYREAAARYLGPDAGGAWCASLEGRAQVVLHLTPRWATAGDMSRSPFLAEDG